MFAVIFFLLIAINIWLWRRLSLLSDLSRPRLYKALLNTWLSLMVVLLVVHFVLPGIAYHWVPSLLSAASYIWFLLILPITSLAVVTIGIVGSVAAAWARRRHPAPPADPPSPSPAQDAQPAAVAASQLSRRQLLTVSALAAPPLATLALSGVGLRQIGRFRIQPYHLAFPSWPAALDGLTIAVVADVHTGIFTTPRMLDDIVRATNDLAADLIFLAGDLINISLHDLPIGLDMACRLSARYGVFMIQGNHDLIQDEETFNSMVRQRGMDLLLDEIRTLAPAGVPIQILGTKWGGTVSDRAASVDRLVRLRDPNLFPIMLAHHPHTWDPARAHGLPLVISGHTHGGQIMLTKNIGGGPIRFKYWTGIHEAENSTLVISNGVGNWFPVRINAPAEILHITLHRAQV